MDFKNELKSFLTVFEPYRRRYFVKKTKEAASYSPLIRRFYEDLSDFSEGGKKLRAFLVYLGYRVRGLQELKNILPLSLAAEIFHSFLLIHDDIIDKSDTRHGKATIHKRYERKYGKDYGVGQAIILGDIACFEALGLVNSSLISDPLKSEVISKFVKVLIETGYGQALDIENSYREPAIGDIWKVTDLKTARYTFVGPMTVGALVSGTSSAQLKVIETFGGFIGKAFQLQDDMLGVFGDEKVMGKSTLSDMREGKNTVLIHKARELASGSQKKLLSKIWGNQRSGRRELAIVSKIIRDSGSLEWCEQEKLRLVESAIKTASKITNSDDLRQIFVQLVRYCATRQS